MNAKKTIDARALDDDKVFRTELKKTLKAME